VFIKIIFLLIINFIMICLRTLHIGQNLSVYVCVLECVGWIESC